MITVDIPEGRFFLARARSLKQLIVRVERGDRVPGPGVEHLDLDRRVLAEHELLLDDGLRDLQSKRKQTSAHLSYRLHPIRQTRLPPLNPPSPARKEQEKIRQRPVTDECGSNESAPCVTIRRGRRVDAAKRDGMNARTHLVHDEMGGGGGDVVLSDGAPRESGHQEERNRGSDRHFESFFFSAFT